MHLCLSLDIGGAEMLVVQMVNDQSKRLEGPHALATLGPSTTPLLIDQLCATINHRDMGMTRGLNWNVILKLRRYIFETNTHVIHAHNPSPLLAAVMASVGLPTTIIYTHHGSGVPPIFNRHPLLRDWLVRRTTAFVGVSPEATVKLNESFAGRIPQCKLHTIINGIAAPKRSTRAANALEKPGLPHFDGYTIGYVGRLAVEKRVENLVEAAALLSRKGIRCRVALVGDGAMRASIEAQARKLGMGPSVLFLGVQSNVAELLGSFDLFVNCSYTEGISLGILEAMAAGLPIVATRVGGTPILIEDGVSGTLIDPDSVEGLASSMVGLLSDSAERQRLGCAAKRRVIEHFSFRAMMDRYEDLYV